jgi:peptide/nickel transport system permease protein
MATTDDDFGSIDWSEHEPRRFPMGRRTVAFLAAFAGLLAAFAYDYAVLPPDEPLLDWWDVTRMDWLFLAGLLVLLFYALVPLWTNRKLTRRYWRRLRRNRLGVASLAFLVVFFLTGLLGPVVLDVLRDQFGITAAHTPYGINARQPPLGFSISVEGVPPLGRAGRMVEFGTGGVANERCHGSIAHPLGTTNYGADVLTLTVDGARTALQLAVITSAIIAPLAVAVGTAAAQVGNRGDRLLTGTIDVIEVIPPFFVYIVVATLYTEGLLYIVLVFGLLGWGGMARLVRSDALQENQAGYVTAARSAGASRLSIIRKHVVPNVSNTVVTSLTLHVPTIIVVEATLAYLQVGKLTGAPGRGPSRTYPSWGTTISLGFEGFPSIWWIIAGPAAFLFLTVVAFNLFGDALRDVLDPRLEVKQ